MEEDPIVIGKELPQLKFDLFSSKFTPHPSYKYPVRNINNITDIPFPSQMVQLRKKISKNGPSNFKDGNYYLEIEYGNLISAVSQEMPFSNIPEESRKPWFKVLIYSGINKDGNPNKEKWMVPYFLRKDENMYLDISDFGELEDIKQKQSNPSNMEDFGMSLGLPGLDSFDDPLNDLDSTKG